LHRAWIFNDNPSGVENRTKVGGFLFKKKKIIFDYFYFYLIHVVFFVSFVAKSVG